LNPVLFAQKEIELLHEQIRAWFRGETEFDAIDDLMACFAADFAMVTTQGARLDRAGVGLLFTQHHGARKGLEITVDDVAIIHATESHTLATYREIQSMPDGTDTHRISAVLLSRNDGARPLWRYLQETVTPAAAKLQHRTL
jgi:hypothetical protein